MKKHQNLRSLPDSLVAAIDKELQGIPRHVLAAAAKELSTKYRSQDVPKGPPLIGSDAQRLAYLAVRLPATFAAVASVLHAIMEVAPEIAPKSLKDIGCGPATATFACLEAMPSIEQVNLFEMDAGLISLGKRLLESYGSAAKTSWTLSNVTHPQDFPESDLSIISYAVGELAPEAADALVERSWKSTKELLVIVEPGTPRGFGYIDRARDLLRKLGAFIVAPCPHQNKCPMQHPDWCHFSCRLDRTEMHLLVKEVDRGFEDEKFSYIAVTRSPVPLPDARILRHPEHHSGHTSVVLCTPEGIVKETISRKHGARYKAVKKASWGDVIEKE